MEDLLTIAELAELLKVKPKTVSNMISKGIFKEGVHFVRPPGLGTRFKQSAVDRWVEGNDANVTGVTFPVRDVVNGR